MAQKNVRLRLTQYLPLCLIFLHETFRDDYPYIEEHSCQFLLKSDKVEISAFLGLIMALEVSILVLNNIHSPRSWQKGSIGSQQKFQLNISKNVREKANYRILLIKLTLDKIFQTSENFSPNLTANCRKDGSINSQKKFEPDILKNDWDMAKFWLWIKLLISATTSTLNDVIKILLPNVELTDTKL